MKQLWLLFLILPIILWTSCETESLPSETPQSLPGNILSRSNGIESLPEGSKILLNALGGVIIEDEIFTYNSGSWSNSNGYQWENPGETTYITALHPHDISSLYEEGALKDILIAQDTLNPRETDITLNFKHLFASFTLNVEESLIDEIAEIKLTSPKTIESISSITGEITLSNTSTTTILSGNNNSSYEFIIPPMQESLVLDITLKSGTSKSYTLQRQLFKSGFVYECTLRDWNMVPGIRNEEQFIAFCQLINGIPNDKFTLSDFSEEKNGKIIYRLLADINLEGQSIIPICNETNKYFNHIFNGENYTISNLTITASGGVAGIFGKIGSEGLVKNLHLKNCSISIEENAAVGTGVGSIVGLCTGTIANCSVINGNISNKAYSSFTGGMVGTLRNGTIVNCFIQNSQVKTTQASVGGVVGKIETGNIINCFSASNTITKNNNYSSGFCGYADNGNIINSYVYKITLKTDTKRGQFIGHGINSIVSYCYTNTSTPNIIIYNENNSSTVSSCKTYSSKFMINEYHIVEVLNQWITNNQSSYNYTFNAWEEDETGTLPAIFAP